ncbi:MAG TPA: class I SAM-dependent methyltransferase [Bryobacteraceae bacterium]|nr:class I SAM-dependent methyltransferase [Bryobacteraceae bacterium]
MYKTEQQHLDYWSARKMDWKSGYLDTWEHPHRQMIVDALSGFQFDSVLEVGCAAGANLFRIHRDFPKVRLSGTDVNAQAIEAAREFLNGDLRVGTLAQAGFPDRCADVVLTDMVLIYVARIEEELARIRRIARKHIVLCEFHSERWWERAALKLATGYRARDYRALLRRQGWRAIEVLKIPRESWPGGRPQRRFGYVITARI